MKTINTTTAINNAEYQPELVDNREIKSEISDVKKQVISSLRRKEVLGEQIDVAGDVLYKSQQILNEGRTAMRLGGVLNSMSNRLESVNNSSFTGSPELTTKLGGPFTGNRKTA